MESPEPRVVAAWSGVLGAEPDLRALAAGRVWEALTADGVGFVLKRATRFDGTEPGLRLTNEARILAHLAGRGLPVAVPVLTDAGHAYAIGGDGALHTLTPLLPSGKPTAARIDGAVHYRNVGSVLARLHVALAQCPYGIDSWEESSASLDVAWRRIEARLPATELADLTEVVRPWWSAMAAALDGPCRQRVHGDAHGGNILTDNDVVTGIVDIDHLPIAARVYDLGYYLATGVRWLIGYDDPDRTHPRDQPDQAQWPASHEIAFIANHLLSGYAGVSALSRRELEAIPAIGMAVCLFLVGHFAHQHDLVERSWIWAAEWIRDHPDAVTSV